MYLKRLFLLNYRNVAQAEMELSPRINCFLGSNGMGKTNVLDAIHYLSFCRSSLNPSDSMVIKHGADCMMLQGVYCMDNGETVEISCSLKPGSRKQFRRDRKDYRRFSDHIGLVPLVMISPDDMLLLTGGSDERRRFMDVVISQYDREYLGYLIDYNKALAQRNALLKADGEPDRELFLMWETVMDRCAALIYERRREFIGRIVPHFQDIYSRIGAEGESVGLAYTSDLERGALSDMLEAYRPKERIVGYTLHGVHRDDIVMTLGGYPIRREGSQGQNKSYLTALKLAQYLYLTVACGGKRPLLLLDDLFDRLDADRVSRILEVVSGDAFGQIFITDVKRSHVDAMLGVLGSDFRIFTIADGSVE